MLLEGLRISQKALSRFLSEIVEDDTFRMGFEVEFYADQAVFGAKILDISEANLSEVMHSDIFVNPQINMELLNEYKIANKDDIADHVNFDEEEVKGDFRQMWFEENPNWWEEYKEEHQDEEVISKEAAKINIEKDIDDGLLGTADFNDVDEYLNERFEDFVDLDTVADYWWDSDPHNFITSMEWELDPDYAWSEHDKDVVQLRGGGFAAIASDLQARVREPVDWTSDVDLVGWGSTEEWEVKPDGTSGRMIEISSPVFPFIEGIEELDRILSWMDDQGFETDALTGLHISLSFSEEKTFDEIDWVKLAVLSGEEHVLRTFGRLDNTYAASQLERLRTAAKDLDLQGVKNWQGFDKLRQDLKSAISSEQHSSFSIEDYGKGGRIEFRVWGGRDYPSKIDEIRDSLMKFAFVLKSASDPEMFKKEYMRKLLALVTKAMAQEDPLEQKYQKLYGDEEEAKYYRRNPFYPIAAQVFKNDPLVFRRYQELTVEAEKRKEADATVREHTHFRVLMDSIANYVGNYITREYENVFSRLRTESVLTEQIVPSKRIQSMIRLIRNTVQHYNFTKEDFKARHEIDADVALMAHVPIADHLVGQGEKLGHAASIAAILFPDADAEHAKTRQYILDLAPVLAKLYYLARGYILRAFSASKKAAVSKEHSFWDVIVFLGDAIIMQYEHAEVDEQFRELVLELMNDFGIKPSDLIYSPGRKEHEEIVRRVLNGDPVPLAAEAAQQKAIELADKRYNNLIRLLFSSPNPQAKLVEIVKDGLVGNEASFGAQVLHGILAPATTARMEYGGLDRSITADLRNFVFDFQTQIAKYLSTVSQGDLEDHVLPLLLSGILERSWLPNVKATPQP